METKQPGFAAIAGKTIVTHSISYMLMGILASTLFNYRSLFTEPGLESFMRPFDSPWITAGPALQPIRGLLFGVVFFLLRGCLFGRRRGWLVMWAMLVIVGILSTFGPSPGSIEGAIYTLVPLPVHLRGLPEVVLQALALAFVLTYWVEHPEKRWLTWVLGVCFVLTLVFPLLGLLFGGAAG